MSDRRVLFEVFVGLQLLLAATIGVSFLHLGAFNPILNFSIAGAKAGLIAWFFMHLRAASGIVRLFAGAALLWLVILFALGLSDWIAR
jgi:cytochrome c oxidase subunit IV